MSAATWEYTTVQSAAEALQILTELRGKHWICRGQPRSYSNGLRPSIDRGQDLSRLQQLRRERQSIDLFRATARFFAHEGERVAMEDDIVTLMVLQHYGVPTRLLDWSTSPFVAAFFATSAHADNDGEIWSFDQRLYEQNGKKQWKEHPETTKDRSGRDDQFDAKLTAFTVQQPPDWIICSYYSPGFPRQNAQDGMYTMTASFDRDHGDKMATLLGDRSSYRRYVIRKEIKQPVLALLREEHGIWQGSLFPDAAGAAATVKALAFGDDYSREQ